MRWTIIITLILLTLLGVGIYYITQQKADTTDSLENKTVEEASPRIIETSQTKLKEISGKVDSNGTVERIMKSVSYTESKVGDILVLKRQNDYLNLNESIKDVYGNQIFERDLTNYLRKGYAINHDQKSVAFEQRIILGDKIYYTYFRDKEYLGNNQQYYGFVIPKDTNVLNYTLTFTGLYNWEDLKSSYLMFMGNKYYIFSSSQGNMTLQLFEKPIKIELKEGEVVRINYPEMPIKEVMINSLEQGRFSLDVNGAITPKYIKGQLFNEGGLRPYLNFYVEDVTYSDKVAGSVTLVLSPRIITISREGIFWDEHKIEGLYPEFSPLQGNTLEKIIVSWKIKDKTFLTTVSPLVIPYFNNLNFTLGKSGYDENYKEYANLSLNTAVYNLYM